MNKKKTGLYISYKNIFIIHKQLAHSTLLVVLSLVINFSALLVSKRSYFCSGLIAPHGEVAYNIYAHNTTRINKQRLEYVLHAQRTQQRLINYYELDRSILNLMPNAYRSIHDTIGYGVLLGLCWKLTHSLSYNDLMYLQIALFCIAIIYMYAIGLLFFNKGTYALISCIILLSLHALIFINVRALRDSWAFYGLVVLIYDFMSFYSTKRSIKSCRHLLHVVFFCLCVWLRPTLVVSLLGMGVLAIFWLTEVGRLWLTYMLGALLLFWAPFLLYNKHAYNSYVVSCAGHDLLAGLGEFDNPWGAKLSDTWVADTLHKRYTCAPGTPTYETYCIQEFIRCVKQQPLVYCRQLMRRSLQLILFYAMIHEWEEYNYCLSKAESLFTKIIIRLMHVYDYLQRAIRFGCWYILLGWLGIILMFAHRRWYETLILIICALSGASKFLSHIETRYLIAHYSFFCFAIMYALIGIKNYVQKRTL